MYKRTAQGWMKHFDFIFLDEVCLQIAFVLAYAIRMGDGLPYPHATYRTMAILLVLCDFLVAVLFNTMHNVLKRGLYLEGVQTLKQCLFVFFIILFWLFSIHRVNDYSRTIVMLTLGFHLVLGYIGRLLLKRRLLKHGGIESHKQKLLAVLDNDTAESIMERLTHYPTDTYQVVGVVLADAGDKKEILGVPVVCSMEEAAAYICREWIDGIYISSVTHERQIRDLMDACKQMAVTVHYHVPSMTGDDLKQFAEKIGNTTVLTTSVNYATPLQLFLKRAIDIVGGLAGSLAALLIIAFVGPRIKKASPGPILYRQERIGQNGRRFKIIKIRSMYMDADARKKELMEQNRVTDGMMFKLEFDPRIIGNEILPDGTKKTGIGEFIRRTSLDEFPQFWNVLKGEMSLVGTRPPTVDEWEKYEFHHRARLACKPGITGMWQVSGRSEITDFEEVVRLDTEYISKWSIGLDLKILIKTVGAVFAHKGAM